MTTPREDLERELVELEKQLAERKRQLDAIKQKEKADTVNTVKEFINQYALEPQDLFSRTELLAALGGQGAATAKAKAPKEPGSRKYNTYRNPENPSETWVRKPGPPGRNPEWFNKLKEDEAKLAECLVKDAT